MNFFQKRNRWKIVLFLLAVSIVFFTLWYTHRLAEDIAKEEIKKATEIADAYKVLNSNSSDELELSKALDKIKLNSTIPVIWANAQDEILAEKNFDSIRIKKDKQYLSAQLKALKADQQFIPIELPGNEVQYLYYKDSYLLVSIRKYPFYVLALVALFFVISYAAFTSARRAEQNQVWVGLAKETAHQLGTPVSSLKGWIEVLKEISGNEKLSVEMEKDVNRLELISDRFGKIGSKPSLEETNITEQIYKMVDYIKKRAGGKVNFVINQSTLKTFEKHPSTSAYSLYRA